MVNDVTERKSNSRERNSARPTIGKAPRDPVKIINGIRNLPGPQSYNTMKKKSMGDESSVKITFGTAERPISARPGKIRKIHTGPGPSDYM